MALSINSKSGDLEIFSSSLTIGSVTTPADAVALIVSVTTEDTSNDIAVVSYGSDNLTLDINRINNLDCTASIYRINNPMGTKDITATFDSVQDEIVVVYYFLNGDQPPSVVETDNDSGQNRTSASLSFSTEMSSNDILFTAVSVDSSSIENITGTGTGHAVDFNGRGNSSNFLFGHIDPSSPTTPSPGAAWATTEPVAMVGVMYTEAVNDSVSLTGQASTVNQGSTSITAGFSATLTGQVSTSGQGPIAALLNNDVLLMPDALSVGQGSLTITSTVINQPISSPPVTVELGSVSPAVNSTVSISGFLMTSQQGSVFVWGEKLTNDSNIWTEVDTSNIS